MMRCHVTALGVSALSALGVLLAFPGKALADGPPSQSNVMLSKDVAPVPMAEWEVNQRAAAEQTGARILIAAGEADTAKAPPSASRYESQTFTFSPGELRVLKFSKANGGVLHQITTETELYVVKGSATVGVRGVATAITAGDVVNLPSGVLRSMPGKPEDTIVLAFTVANTDRTPQAALVKGADVKLAPQTRGPKVGVGGTKLAVRRYAFDGNSIRVAHLSGRGTTSPYTGNVDVLLYIASGKLKIHVGDEEKEVSAGDVLREEAGKTTFWNVSEPATFVATNSPPRYSAAKP